MGYLLEKEIENIINTVKAKTIGEGESITLDGVLRADIHPALKAYIKEKVSELLRTEKKQEVRSKKFNYETPEIVSLLKYIDLLLIRKYQFGQEEFLSLVDEAVHFQFNYLCRPQWTLLGFIFENQRRISFGEIERKFEYCVDYSYYSKIIKRYFTQRGFAEVAYEEFKEILEKIDKEIVTRHSSVELAGMMKSLFSFLEAAQTRLPSNDEAISIPVQAAIVFFEDKGLNEVKKNLEALRDRGELINVTMEQLALVIEGAYIDSTHQKVLKERTTISVSEAEKFPIPNVSGNREIVKEQKNNNGQDLLKIPQEQKVVKVFGEDEVGTYTNRLPELITLFSKTEQKKFIKQLFRKNEIEFRNAIALLNNCKNWEESSICLDKLFITMSIDPFCDIAVAFTDIVLKRFNQQ